MHLKHHIYSEIAELPVDEFNIKMREIMANTKEGKSIVKEIANRIKQELNEEEYLEAMNEISSHEKTGSDSQGFDLDELINGTSNDNSDDDTDNQEGFDIGELF